MRDDDDGETMDGLLDLDGFSADSASFAQLPHPPPPSLSPSSPSPPSLSPPSPSLLPNEAPSTTSSARSIIHKIYTLVSSCKSVVSFSRRIPVEPSTSPNAQASPRPEPSSSALRNPRNQRVARKRRHIRDTAYREHEEAMSHPLTRGPLTFSAHLVEKYGTVNVADTLRMNWFSVPRIAHAIGAWIRLPKFKASKVAG